MYQSSYSVTTSQDTPTYTVDGVNPNQPISLVHPAYDELIDCHTSVNTNVTFLLGKRSGKNSNSLGLAGKYIISSSYATTGRLLFF